MDQSSPNFFRSTWKWLWLIKFFSDVRYVDPFRRYSRSKSKVVKNRVEIWTIFWPSEILGGMPSKNCTQIITHSPLPRGMSSGKVSWRYSHQPRSYWGAGQLIVDKMGTIFTMPAPKKCVTAKKSCKSFRDYWELSSLIANISGTDLYIEHLKKTWSTATPSTLDERNLVNFGPQTKSSRGAYWATQVDIFRETTFRPLGGAAPSNFYTR